MSKFYEVEIQIDKDGKESKGIYTYEDENPKVARDKAAAVYHQKMASGMQAENLKSVLNLVINEHGGVEPDLKSYWEKANTEEINEVEA